MNIFYFVLAMLVGENPAGLGTDVLFITTFDTQARCEEMRDEAPEDLKPKLACLAIVKPGVPVPVGT